jgi:hypothetical protein
MIQGVKACRICGVVKPLEDFYVARGARDGRRTECKSCNLAARRAKHAENPRPYIDRVLRWQRENPELYRAKLRDYAESGKKRIADRKSHLKRKYGLTIEQYDAMLAAQAGGCAICGEPPRDDIELHVDHDHTTGAVRGLLCFRCNNAIGDLREATELFEAAAAYLDRHASDDLVELARRRAFALARVA